MRSWAFKLFTLLLAALLLLSFSTPTFALPLRYYLVIRDLDDNGYPHAKTGRFLVLPLGWGSGYLLMVRIETKKNTVSETNSTTKQSESPRVDEEIR